MTDTPAPHEIAAIDLADPDGSPVTLGDHAADPLVVILVRYFGCLPCQQFLTDVDGSIGAFPEGSDVIAVGGSSAHQARWLRDKKDVRIPLLLDPDQRVRAVAGLGELTAQQLSSARGWRSYGRALRSGFRPQIPTTDALKAPGIIMFDAGFSTSWIYAGERMGDYPPVAELIERVGDSASS